MGDIDDIWPYFEAALQTAGVTAAEWAAAKVAEPGCYPTNTTGGQYAYIYAKGVGANFALSLDVMQVRTQDVSLTLTARPPSDWNTVLTTITITQADPKVARASGRTAYRENGTVVTSETGLFRLRPSTGQDTPFAPLTSLVEGCHLVAGQTYDVRAMRMYVCTKSAAAGILTVENISEAENEYPVGIRPASGPVVVLHKHDSYPFAVSATPQLLETGQRAYDHRITCDVDCVVSTTSANATDIRDEPTLP